MSTLDALKYVMDYDYGGYIQDRDDGSGIEYGGSVGNIIAAVLWKNAQEKRRAQKELDAKHKNVYGNRQMFTFVTTVKRDFTLPANLNLYDKKVVEDYWVDRGDTLHMAVWRILSCGRPVLPH